MCVIKQLVCVMYMDYHDVYMDYHDMYMDYHDVYACSISYST